LLYRLWTATWRMTIIESETVKKQKSNGKAWICAIWHGDELAMIRFSVRYRVATMTSTSKDGELMDNVLHRLGMETSRGSSTRGGVSALKGMVRLARKGWSPVVAVDGPKGPYHKAKPGVFELAKISDIPIVPVGVHSTSKLVFKKSWNKAYLPLPFSRVVLVWGEEFKFDHSLDSRDKDLASSLESALDAVGRTAVKVFAKR
jgi:lysophospholipid acyltransferase (LPLAT)-like uncharacterized protein